MPDSRNQLERGNTEHTNKTDIIRALDIFFANPMYLASDPQFAAAYAALKTPNSLNDLNAPVAAPIKEVLEGLFQHFPNVNAAQLIDHINQWNGDAEDAISGGAPKNDTDKNILRDWLVQAIDQTNVPIEFFWKITHKLRKRHVRENHPVFGTKITFWQPARDFLAP